jgi:nucleoside-diphosphate-sugar epimerase
MRGAGYHSGMESTKTDTVILLAGGTGDLGGRIAKELVRRGARVRALVRRGTAVDKVQRLEGLGVTAVEVDFEDAAGLAKACEGASCAVSALSGLRDVIVETQTRLLDAAVAAGVPRFIPSDFSIDYTQLPPGSNRNLELRQEFKARLDRAPIAATSILNGAFAEMLTGQAPIILFPRKRVLYWQNAEQRMDFTTMDNVAAFTAAAALDASTPRTLRIAGEQISARELAELMGRLTGEPFRLFRAGGLGRLGWIIKAVRRLFPQPGQLYPVWQGMQYLHNMFGGLGQLTPLDNARYPDLRWTPVQEVLAARAGDSAARRGRPQ